MKCLNCGHIALKKHCPNCGQKTSTHRFSLLSIFDYAVVNAYFSLNAGLLFTLKELLIRPGHAVREYLQGKRAKYLNAFSCFLILMAFSFFVSDFVEEPNVEEYDNVYMQLRTTYPRLFIMLSIPFLGASVFLSFLKIRFNFSEHLVAATYLSAVLLLVDVFCELLRLLPMESVYFGVAEIALFLSYFFYFYYQLFCNLGLKKRTIIFRLILAGILYLFLNLVFIILLELKTEILDLFLK